MNRKQMEEKYKENIRGIAKAYPNYDSGVCLDMLIANAKNLAAFVKGKGNDFYKGMGPVDIDELVVDYANYEKSLPKKNA